MLQKLLLNIVYLCFAVLFFILNLISVGYKLKTTFVIATPGETSTNIYLMSLSG